MKNQNNVGNSTTAQRDKLQSIGLEIGRKSYFYERLGEASSPTTQRGGRESVGQKQQVKFNKNSISALEFYSQQLSKQLKGSGWNDGGLCPFHHDAKAGNFRVNVQHGGFNCFSCGAKGGDVVDFLCLLHGWSYKQAVSYLSDSEICQPKKNRSVKPLPEPDRKNTQQQLIKQWNNANPTNQNHPYLIKKRIEPYGIRQSGRNLLIPAYDTSNRLRAIQSIGENGFKWFSSGSEKKSHFFLVGKDTSKPLIICEGYATGITLLEQTGYQIAVAFDAGNLESVALALRKTHPKHEIIIAADNDRYHKNGTPRKDNPGLKAATKAAKRINAKLAVPEFPDGVMGSDFNDLANLEVLV
jgi:putative DNA primase/helicase